MKFNDRLTSALDNLNSDLYGYRSFAYRDPLLDVLHNGIKAKGRDTYWSYRPVIYYYYSARDGKSISITPRSAEERGLPIHGNIVEASFDKSDPGFLGFGDGAPLFQFVSTGEHTRAIEKLPPDLKRKLVALKDRILSDPDYAEDWSFAGIMPKDYVNEFLFIIGRGRPYLKFEDLYDKEEFNYNGDLGFKGQSSIVGIYEFRFNYTARPSLGDAEAVAVLYTSPKSKIDISRLEKYTI